MIRRSRLDPRSAGLAATLLVLATVAAAEEAPPPTTVPHVDLERYVGLWHEVARIPNRFQDQCVGNVTAEYEIDEEGRIRVTNSCDEADGGVSRARGVARVVDRETNARLKVSFVSFLGVRPFWGDYWIIGLGEDYDYAVIGTPNRKYGWILARQPDPGPETMERIWRIVTEQGYDPEQFARSAP
jgi:apolipoprotein D and lipocalin family protein